MSNNNSKNWEINTENAIKNIPYIVIGFVIIAIILGYLMEITFDTSNDLLNTSTMTVEIIFRIFIALIVYVYSKKQNKITEQQQNIAQLLGQSTSDQQKIGELVTEIKNLEEDQEKLINFQETFLLRNAMFYSNVVFFNLLIINHYLITEQRDITELFLKKL